MDLLEPLPTDTPPNVPQPVNVPRGTVRGTAALPIGNQSALPDGTPLRMTISRKVVMETMWTRPGRNPGEELAWVRSQNSEQDLVVLWFCCHDPADWMAIGLYPIWLDGPESPPHWSALPLWQRYTELVQTVMEWADASCLSAMTTAELYDQAKQLWEASHANKAEPIPTEKKTEEVNPPESPPIGATNTPASSPEATPAG